MQTVAALTILGDDTDFVKAWLRHYTRQVGAQNCYLVCAGPNPELQELARQSSVITLPAEAAKALIRKRGRIMNNFIAALLGYHKHVVVTHPDEMVIVDPDVAPDLQSYLLATPARQVLTPLGLELIHRGASEPDHGGGSVPGPRHGRIMPELCKPCILSTPTSLSRDGRYSRYAKLRLPEPLFLLRLKGPVSGGGGPQPEVIDGPKVQEGFDLSAQRRQMQESWKKMDLSAYWHFEAREDNGLYLLPERFSGLV
jgi:hypothetical protein